MASLPQFRARKGTTKAGPTRLTFDGFKGLMLGLTLKREWIEIDGC